MNPSPINSGRWQGNQVIPEGWVDESTQPYLPENYADYYPEYFALRPGKAYYRYMWWGFARDGVTYDFTAAGDKGQYIYVSPEKNLVIVRNGIEYGISSQAWIRLFYEFSSRF